MLIVILMCSFWLLFCQTNAECPACQDGLMCIPIQGKPLQWMFCNIIHARPGKIRKENVFAADGPCLDWSSYFSFPKLFWHQPAMTDAWQMKGAKQPLIGTTGAWQADLHQSGQGVCHLHRGLVKGGAAALPYVAIVVLVTHATRTDQQMDATAWPGGSLGKGWARVVYLGVGGWDAV